MGRAIEPYYKIGETFEFQGHTLMSVECEEHECTGCFFHDLIPNSTAGCVDNFDVHGICAASDIGRKKSIKFIEVKDDKDSNKNNSDLQA